MPNITKQDLIQDIARSTGFIQSDIRTVVESFFSVVAEGLTTGSNIEIRGFGTFQLKSRKPRPARNPRTGEEVLLEERQVPLFKFSADLKRRISESEMYGVPAAPLPVHKSH